MQEAQHPKRPPRIFYGWVMVLALGLVGGVAVGMGGVNFGLFVTPMGDELGISKASFGLAHTARIVGVAFSAPFIGRILDRFGPRVPLAVAGALSGLGVLVLAHVSEAWQMIGVFALLGFVGLQGGIMLYTTVPIAKWFIRRRGKAMAWSFIGVPIGIAITGPLTQFSINHVGWRDTWTIFGSVGAVAVMTIALLVLRRQPEDMGLLPDGDTAKPVMNVEAPLDSTGAPTAHERTWSMVEAIRTGVFWRLAIVFGLMMFAQSTMVVFRFPFFEDQGIDKQLVAFTLTAEALTGVGVLFIWGIFMDRFRTHYVGVFGFLILTIALLLIMSTDSTWRMFLATTVYGIGIPTILNMQNTIWPAYFGRANVGSIRGLALPVTLALGAIGAPITGRVNDVTGSYFPVWWAAVGALLIGAILVGLTPRPKLKNAGAYTA
jgi:MFS family permease